VPRALRQALDIAAGDRLRFLRTADGTVRIEARKRRSIVDIARANAVRVGQDGLDLDAAIDASITAAVEDRNARARAKSGG